ncbi:MAG: cupin domain-containing protein [Proteobacteria bacterium]|nr:cupin domain-containing protein [Pseudomonadota bacterium]
MRLPFCSRIIKAISIIFVAGAVITSAPSVDAQDPTEKDYISAKTLLTAGKNIVGETIAYPTGKAKISSLVITIAPGTETGWHKHGVPLYAYILSGEVTVDYGDKGKRTYKAGEAFMEAMDNWHNGVSTGSEPVRILTVYMGADGASNVIHKK